MKKLLIRKYCFCSYSFIMSVTVRKCIYLFTSVLEWNGDVVSGPRAYDKKHKTMHNKGRRMTNHKMTRAPADSDQPGPSAQSDQNLRYVLYG